MNHSVAPTRARVIEWLAVESGDESPNLWHSLAEVYIKAEDKKTAKGYFEKSLKLDPKNESAREQLKKIASH